MSKKHPFLFPSPFEEVNPASVSTGISSPQDLLFNVPNYSSPDQLGNMVLDNVGSEIKTPGSGFGMNLDTAKLALSGLGTIGKLWAAFQAQKLAKKQFDFTKRITETNLANQVQSYNTTLEDRGRSRAFAEGQSAADAQSYIDKNRLTTGG